jgi:hypothetical protein
MCSYNSPILNSPKNHSEALELLHADRWAWQSYRHNSAALAANTPKDTSKL